MQEAVQYVNYSDYKNIEGVEVQWPLEISEEIAQDVIDFVKRNMKASEINSMVRILYFLYLTFDFSHTNILVLQNFKRFLR